MKIEPYLFFDGRCDEAIEFYKQVLDAKVDMLMRFSESPDPTQIPPGSENKVMHGSLLIGDSRIMVSDGMCQGQAKFEGVSLSITAKDVIQAEQLFAALSADGQVQMPMGETFFSPRFGMVADKFGVSWMVVVAR